jgi:predicted transcriptional regulator
MTPTELKSARKELGLSQQGLAEALDYHGSDANRLIRRMEAGTRPIPPRVSEGIKFLQRGAKRIEVLQMIVCGDESRVLERFSGPHSEKWSLTGPVGSPG